jgi:hypothetical protein
MDPELREKSINSLTNRQALSITKYMTDLLEEIAPAGSIPYERNLQTKALSTLLNEHGYEVDLIEVDPKQPVAEEEMGEASKNFLIVVARTNNVKLLSHLDSKLENPPVGGKASIESLVTIFPIVITGCIALLTVTNGIKYKDGKLTYNTTDKDTREAIRSNVSDLTSIIKPLVSKIRNS